MSMLAGVRAVARTGSGDSSSTSVKYALSNRKRLLDFVVALAGLTVTALMFPVVAVAIKASSPGPVFYRQDRLGLGGRVFSVLKFRTMRPDAESDGRARWSSPEDDRVTSVGRFMRKYHVDEFPQWWNVLTGEMSVVGPRPERPELAVALESSVPGFSSRTTVKPGLTGLAQLEYEYTNTARGAHVKLRYDRVYIESCSAALDITIILSTARSLLPYRGR
jgi:lipopolysaccharide/colanic/teichoic acid biosynthesis glycosyltransferase